MRRIYFLSSLFMIFLAAACGPALPTSEPTPQSGQPVVLPSQTGIIPSPNPTIPPSTQPAAEPTSGQPPIAGLDDEEFDQALARAFEEKDMTTLRSLMKEHLSFATYDTQLLEVTSEEALQQLGAELLAEGSTPAVRFDTDVTALLGGADPLGQWGPVANPARAMHVVGLGSSARQEAMLVVGRDAATGQLYWHGILLPQYGYFGAPTPIPGIDAAVTDVRQVEALDELNVRSGPGLNYASEGIMRTGEIAQVAGKSQDGGWWLISCTTDSSGYCWISADPELSKPVANP